MVRLRVAVRVRPPEDGQTSHVICDDRVGTQLAVRLPAVSFHQFAVVLGPGSSQTEAFAACGAPMLKEAFQGRDSLLFSYGQAGAGKTHSLYGAEGGMNAARLDGVVPTLVSEIFRRTTSLEKDGSNKFALTATLIEVQGQNLVDMFADYSDAGEPQYVKVSGGLRVEGARSERVYTGRNLAMLLERAMAQAALSGNGTACHRILTLSLERKTYVDGEHKATSVGNCYVIDLAGTETFDLENLANGRWINRGVLAMGRIVLSLAEGGAHVPYRDYPLTKVAANAARIAAHTTARTTTPCAASPARQY